MKDFKISTQTIYIIIASMLLLLIVFMFSLNALIPRGKDYRSSRIDLKKEHAILDQYTQKYDDTYARLKELQSKNEHIIKAFSTSFKEERFIKQNKDFFKSLKLSPLKESNQSEPFNLYEVQTVSSIDSPQQFYQFLNAINKSDWIIRVDFPITFQRDDRLITATFTMKVFSDVKQKNKN